MSREILTVDDRARPTLAVDGAVWLCTAALVLGSYAFVRAHEPDARVDDALGGAVSAAVPGGWASSELDGTLTLEHPSMDGMPPTVRVRRLAGSMDPMARDLAVARMEQERAGDGAGFRVLHVDEVTDGFGGNQATLVWWAMAQDPPGSRAGDAVLPLVVEGVDALVLAPDGSAFHVAAFEAANGLDVENELRQTLLGVRIIGGGGS